MERKQIGVLLVLLVSIVGMLFGFEQNVNAETIEFPGDLYEAEDANGEGIIVDNKHLGFTGEGFVDYKPNEPGGFIEWEIEVAEEATYVLAFRYAHGKADNRHAELQVDGEVVDEQLDFNQSGDFDDYIYVTKKVELSKGTHTVKLTATAEAGGANIDHLYVYQDVDIVEEAEDQPGEGVIIDNKHQGFTGTGFVDYNPNVPGGYIEWTVDVPVAGLYQLDFRYAHAGGSNRPAEISVNGSAIEELDFAPTGDWAGWSLDSTSLELEAGENVIRLTATGAEGGGNIDHLRIHNQLEEENEHAPVETKEVALDDLIDGVTKKKLQALGVIKESSVEEDALVTGKELLALINRRFGFDMNQNYKNLDERESIGSIKKEEWDIYVAEIAKENKYVPDFLWEEVDLNQPLSKEKIALIVGDLMDLVPEEEEGPNMMGKLAKLGIMNPNREINYGIKDEMTLKEAEEMIDQLASDSDKVQNEVNMVRVDALAPHLIAVTLNGQFSEVNIDDISLTIPTGSWDSLSPLLNQELRLPKAAVTKDKFGNTVVLFETMEKLEGDKFYLEEDEPSFQGDLDAALLQANHMMSWQMDHGGWSKGNDYTRPWDQEEERSEWINDDGIELGMIDNDATIKEMEFLAEVYAASDDDSLKQSFQKGLDFLFDLQYDSGGFAQVYPRRGNYSDMVTFNDEAMIRVLNMFEDIVQKKYPYHTDIITDAQRSSIEESIDKAIDYILHAQIEANGKLTAWGQQHDPNTYESVQGRAYEHPSISGKESVAIVQFLMERTEGSPEITEAVEAALAWYDEVKLDGIRYVSGGNENGEYFVEDENAVTWYRFYEMGTNKPIFSGRDGVIKHDIQEIEEERRNGYQWGGSYGQLLLETAKTTGYFKNNVYAKVVAENSKDELNRSLVEGELEKMEDFQNQVTETKANLTVAKDGSGDFDTIQAAIDAVPVNANSHVEVMVKNGIYEEVVNIPSDKPYIHLIGESEQETIIRYDNYAGKDNGVGGTIGTSGSATVFIRSNDVIVENLTIENSFDESLEVDGKQAVALYAAGERMLIHQVTLLGNQDTLFAHSGTQYYLDSYIEGDVDFIFGGAQALFENVTVHSLDRGSDSNNGYITAASTMDHQDFGFLFLNSTLTSDAPDNSVYLGRPWQPSSNPSAIAHVVYKDSVMGAHIKEEGWTEMGGFPPEEAKLYEFNNEGPGAVINEDRRQLTEEEAATYTKENVLGGWVPNVPE